MGTAEHPNAAGWGQPGRCTRAESRSTQDPLWSGGGAPARLDAPVAYAGKTLGRYRVLERVGAGAMGAVYEAIDPRLQRRVAIKVLHRNGDESRQLRLLREARALARINHPNVVPVFEASRERGVVFIVMEFVEGPTLREWMMQKRSPAEIEVVLVAAARGLAAAHDAGVVHRDFKPSNVLIDRLGHPRVADFGLAHGPDLEGARAAPSETRRSDALGSTLGRPHGRLATASGTILGTPAYMAPEQHAGRPASAKADQFAFCATAWEVVSGARQFRGEDLDSLALEKRRGLGLERGTSTLAAALRRGLSPAPSDRFDSMHALVGALQRAGRRRRRRRRWIALGAAAFAVVAALKSSDETCISTDTVTSRWGSTQQASVREAFAGTGLPFSRAAGERTIAALDAYTQRWVDTRDATCSTGAGPLRAAQEACLQRRASVLVAATDLLAHADADLVVRAEAVVASLPTVGSCGDASLATNPRRLADPRGAEEIDYARSQLDRIRVQRKARRIQAALADLVDLRGRTASLADRSTRLAIEAEHAYLLAARGRFHDARDATAAVFYTASALGDMQVAADAATNQVHIIAVRLQQPRRARVWLRHARAAVARLGDGHHSVALLRAESAWHRESGRYQDAARSLTSAQELLENKPGAQLKLATVLTDLAGLHALIGDGESAGLWQRVLEIRTATLGESHPSTADAWINLASDPTADLGPAARTEALQRALSIKRPLLGPEHPAVALVHLNLGNAYRALADYPRAIEHLDVAARIYAARFGDRHYYVAAANTNIGHIELLIGRRGAAMSRFREAIDAIQTEFGDGDHRVANPLLGLAGCMAEDGDRAEALELLARVDEICASGCSAQDAQSVGRLREQIG